MAICMALGVLASCSSGSNNGTGISQTASGGAATGGAAAPTAGESAAIGNAAGGLGTLASAGGAGVPELAGSGGAANSAAGTGGLGASAGSSAGGATDAGGATAAGGPSGASGSANGAVGGATSGCAGLLLCDDFESYATGSAPSGRWQTQARGSAKAVIDTAMAYSGTKSVHFTGTVNQDSANIVAQGSPVFPVQGNTVFVRMMMYVQSYPTTSGVHTRVARIGTSTNGSDGTGYAMTTYNGTGVERINEAMVRDTSLHLTDTLVQGKWVCWEWELDNTAGPPMGGKGKVLAHLWRDSTAVTLGATSHTDLSWDPVAWQVLEFGLEAYQADTKTGDFWLDDVAMNTQKIGCPQK